ncbi:hypothetical protein ET989_06440 [Propioniciclava sinopodophylli]|uniref:DUF6458 domain-containing protein n=1 Tax=Propioniciclava sinopodophylli TaxID=1837344 RepID=A0A4Q9KG44_9ACTN|nr:DUF6458 family protein [Propioniciclava sinopodophylli]TBT85382.1 hypothetical protein ET989_06440 [Propioniciclava sinopodophylli]
MRVVNVGGPIALGVIGAILYFAMSDMLQGVDTKMIGLILMAAALLWLVVGLFANRPRSSVTTERTNVQGTGGVAPGHGPGGQSVEREVRHDEL